MGMTTHLPPMTTFGELLRTALGTATHQVVEGSRRNARTALELRGADARRGEELLATLAPAPTSSAAAAGPHVESA